jgi:hypothetical protein
MKRKFHGSSIFSIMDDQVLAFIKVIAPHLTELHIGIGSLIKMANLGDQKRSFINQLHDLFREKLIVIGTSLDNIQFLQDVDNKTRRIHLGLSANTDIRKLMNWLATPRPDGKQRVIWLFFESDQLAMEMVDTLKQVLKLITYSL